MSNERAIRKQIRHKVEEIGLYRLLTRNGLRNIVLQIEAEIKNFGYKCNPIEILAEFIPINTLLDYINHEDLNKIFSNWSPGGCSDITFLGNKTTKILTGVIWNVSPKLRRLKEKLEMSIKKGQFITYLIKEGVRYILEAIRDFIIRNKVETNRHPFEIFVLSVDPNYFFEEILTYLSVQDIIEIISPDCFIEVALNSGVFSNIDELLDLYLQEEPDDVNLISFLESVNTLIQKNPRSRSLHISQELMEEIISLFEYEEDNSEIISIFIDIKGIRGLIQNLDHFSPTTQRRIIYIAIQKYSFRDFVRFFSKFSNLSNLFDLIDFEELLEYVGAEHFFDALSPRDLVKLGFIEEERDALYYYVKYSKNF